MTARTLLWLCCFCSPWCYGLVTLGEQPIAFTDALLPLGIVVWLMQRRHSISPLGLAMASFGAAALLSVALPLADGRGAAAALKVLRLWGILFPAICLSSLRCTDVQWRRYLQAFFWGGTISLSVGIAGFFLQWDAVVATQTYIYDRGAYLHRAGGVFRDSGAYGHLLATWVACSMLLYLPELATRWRWIAGAVVVGVGALGLYASVSRSAALNIGTVLLLSLTLRDARAPLGRRLLAAALVSAFALTAVLARPESESMLLTAGDTVMQRLVESFTSLLGGFDDIERASGGRLTTWVLALDAWSSQPLLGVGYKMLVLSGNPPDNTFVLALCETGMLGFGALAFCFGLIFWRAVDRFAKAEQDGRSFLILWSGQLIHSLNADILTFFGSVPALLILTLIWYRLASARSKAPAGLAGRGRVPRRQPVEAAHSAYLGAR